MEIGSGLIGLVILIADIYAIVKILGSGALTGAKVLWVFIILLLPVIGFILWLLMVPGGKSSNAI